MKFDVQSSGIARFEGREHEMSDDLVLSHIQRPVRDCERPDPRE